jgi:hypothetical protein
MLCYNKCGSESVWENHFDTKSGAEPWTSLSAVWLEWYYAWGWVSVWVV